MRQSWQAENKGASVHTIGFKSLGTAVQAESVEKGDKETDKRVESRNGRVLLGHDEEGSLQNVAQVLLGGLSGGQLEVDGAFQLHDGAGVNQQRQLGVDGGHQSGFGDDTDQVLLLDILRLVDEHPARSEGLALDYGRLNHCVAPLPCHSRAVPDTDPVFVVEAFLGQNGLDVRQTGTTSRQQCTGVGLLELQVLERGQAETQVPLFEQIVRAQLDDVSVLQRGQHNDDVLEQLLGGREHCHGVEHGVGEVQVVGLAGSLQQLLRQVLELGQVAGVPVRQLVAGQDAVYLLPLAVAGLAVAVEVVVEHEDSLMVAAVGLGREKGDYGQKFRGNAGVVVVAGGRRVTSRLMLLFGREGAKAHGYHGMSDCGGEGGQLTERSQDSGAIGSKHTRWMQRWRQRRQAANAIVGKEKGQTPRDHQTG